MHAPAREQSGEREAGRQARRKRTDLLRIHELMGMRQCVRVLQLVWYLILVGWGLHAREGDASEGTVDTGDRGEGGVGTEWGNGSVGERGPGKGKNET